MFKKHVLKNNQTKIIGAVESIQHKQYINKADKHKTCIKSKPDFLEVGSDTAC